MATKRKKGKRTYILNMVDGSREKVTVPSDWKLTFGPLVPGSRDHNVNSKQALVLRFYEGNKDNQRACFSNVASFRDTLEMEMEIERVDRKRQTVQAATPNGMRDFDIEAITKTWENPDKPSSAEPEFQRLPHVMPAQPTQSEGETQEDTAYELKAAEARVGTIGGSRRR